MDLYLGVVLTLIFLSGCFLIVLSVREQLEKRRRERSWFRLSPGNPQKVGHDEPNNKPRPDSGISNRRFMA